jgi:hypothetical protein
MSPKVNPPTTDPASADSAETYAASMAFPSALWLATTLNAARPK